MVRVKVKAILFLIAVSVIALGCMPAPYVYYEPSATGGKLVHSGFNLYEPKNAIEFRFQNIEITVRGQNNWLSINIRIPEGLSAQFVSDEIAVFEDKPENAKVFRITRSSYYDGQPAGYVNIGPTAPLVGRTKPLVKYGLSADRLFEMSAKLDENERDHFYVKLPAIRIGGQLKEFPVIEFVKKTGVHIAYINS